MLHEPTPEVPAQAAYAAALERLGRTTHALVLSEAQVLTLRAELAASERRVKDAEQVTAETKKLMERRTATLLRRAEAAEGVTHDAAASESTAGERATAHGEARSAQDFSD